MRASRFYTLELTPTINSVDDLVTEDDELNFIKAFRDLMRIKNVLTAFSDFKWEDLKMDEFQFDGYKSKYLDLYKKVKHDIQKEKVSILEDVDFELELNHRDEINVAYIIQLLIKLKSQKDTQKIEQEILSLLGTETTSRSKRELIEKFIQENLPVIEDTDEVVPEFDKFWNAEQQKAFNLLVKEENLSPKNTEKIIEDYQFAERQPLRDEVLALIDGDKPSLLQRKKLGDRILARIMAFVETFINRMNKFITHTLPLEDAAHGYKIFDEKKEDCVKVVLKP